ncbi:MAG TPA: DUF5996 family protein [Chloroflexia bacterium]|nr:DUF5996 family protein [Chloroflexia bacterium]
MDINGAHQGQEKAENWPALPFEEWQETCETLHMWSQIVGKIRMELSPYRNHWWQVPFYISARGLTTSPIPYQNLLFEINFDFIDHILLLQTSSGKTRAISLIPRSVADFYRELMAILASVGIEVKINTLPSEVNNPIRCDEDYVHTSYDPEYANRFWQVLVQCDRVFKQFRAGFIGKSSPVHFFWGSFDLAVTRFSGKRAPERPGADAITREAYSHEVISLGFWPGNASFPRPAFYAYAAPEPEGLKAATIQPKQAFYSEEMKEFFLLYDDVRLSENPDQTVLDFAQSTYEAAANLANWDRTNLEAPQIGLEPHGTSV